MGCEWVAIRMIAAQSPFQALVENGSWKYAILLSNCGNPTCHISK